MPVKIKRIYEPYSKDDGYRILIDRLWPRGIKKETAHIDKWLKEIAPSTELRKWFHQEPEADHWEQFEKAYHAELKKSEAVEELHSDIENHETVTLLYAAKNEEQNHAMVLLQFLKE
ncbi:MAG TPA: DUF488 family protein [Mucilaginibacter sp.]|jgi:uncharacterized protein YeaO (DUF488 family)|nr:DUF488 family protein [Mucilaginibacter sp.]